MYKVVIIETDKIICVGTWEECLKASNGCCLPNNIVSYGV